MKRIILYLMAVCMLQTIQAQEPIRLPGKSNDTTTAQPPKIRKSNSEPPVRKELPGGRPPTKDELALQTMRGSFPANSQFMTGTNYYSTDGRYYFTLQEDGNFVVYKVSPSQAIWHTRTNGKAVKSCRFQSDGNLVLYDLNNKPLWNAFTWAGKPLPGGKAVLRMQDDGNLVIYYSNGTTPFWSSNTFEKN